MSTRRGGIAASAGVVGGATLLSRVLGLARDVVLAGFFGAGAGMDAFVIAFMIPNLFRRLVGEGSLTVSFVPVFTGVLERGQEAAREALAAVFTLAGLIGLAIAVGGVLLADPLVSLFAPGFSLEPGKHELAVLLLRWCFPYIFFLVLVSVAMGALNATDHFLAPAIAPVLLNLLLIAGAFSGVRWVGVEPPILALGYAVPVAGLAQVLLQISPLRRRGLLVAPRWQPGHPAVRRLARLMLPAVLGASVFQLNLIVSRFLASYEGEGAVSYLYYADRLLEFPLGVFVFAIGTGSLPAISRAAKAANGAVRAPFTDAVALALALAVPSTIGLVALRSGLFVQLFAWNPSQFGDAAVAGCSAALLYYALGLLPITLSRLYVNLCVAHENTAIGARGAVVGVVSNAIFALALVGPMPAGSLPSPVLAAQHAMAVVDLGFAGLALAASLAAACSALYVAVAAHRRYGEVITAGAGLGLMFRLGVAGAALLGALVVLATWVPIPPSASWAGLARLFTHVFVGASVYGAVLLALRGPEVRAVLGLVRR